MKTALSLSIVFVGVFCCSCASVSQVTEATGKGLRGAGSATAEGFRATGRGISEGYGALASAIKSPFQPNIPITQARPEDFRKPPSAQEQMLAYQQKVNRRNSWKFFAPIEFNEPALPEDGSAYMSDSLLPPKQ